MKKYRFPFERILALRRMEADLVRVGLQRQLAEVTRQDEFRKEIARQVTESNNAVRRPEVTGLELTGAVNFRQYAGRADAMVAAEREKTLIEVRKCRQLVVEAERKVKALETLDERRRLSWRLEMEREVEQAAAESYLARWRPQRASEPNPEADPSLET